MSTSYNRKAEEICVKGNAPQYLGEVTKLVQAIIDDKCEIACDYSSDRSRCQQSFDDETPSKIWISVRKVRAKPIHLVWDIMHEFGHHQSGKPERGEVEDPVRRLIREELAWDKAEALLQDYSTLKMELADFLSYRDFCLIEYRESTSKS